MSLPPAAALDAATLAAAAVILRDLHDRVADAVYEAGTALRSLGLSDKDARVLFGSLDGLFPQRVPSPTDIREQVADPAVRSA